MCTLPEGLPGAGLGDWIDGRLCGPGFPGASEVFRDAIVDVGPLEGSTEGELGEGGVLAFAFCAGSSGAEGRGDGGGGFCRFDCDLDVTFCGDFAGVAGVACFCGVVELFGGSLGAFLAGELVFAGDLSFGGAFFGICAFGACSDTGCGGTFFKGVEDVDLVGSFFGVLAGVCGALGGSFAGFFSPSMTGQTRFFFLLERFNHPLGVH